MSMSRISDSYDAVHRHLRRDRGIASDLECSSEICYERAKRWVYLHNGQPEFTSEKGVKYSTDISCYKPMCVSHHRVYIRERELQETG